MQELDAVIRKTLQLDNLLPNLRGGSSVNKAATLTECNLFEAFPTQSIQRDWYFSEPVKGTRPVHVDLQRLLKQFDLTQTGVKEARALLVVYANEVNRLKDGGGSDEESRLLCYINMIDVLNKVFENNATPYTYVVPSTGETIASDRFLVEYLCSLLSLLALYNRRAVETTVGGERDQLRAKGRLFHLCTEILSEIILLCSKSSDDDNNNNSNKLFYVEPLRSLGTDTKGTTVVKTKEQQQGLLSVCDFVESCLGNGGGEARYHLCMAKKNEVLYALFKMNKNDDDEAEVARMSAVYNAYKSAYELAKDASLYRHARFMAHAWFCRTHLFIVKQCATKLLDLLHNQEESEQELVLAREVLASLLYLTEEARTMEEEERTIIEALEPELEEDYNTMIEELADLTQRFDTELYKNRRVKEVQGMDFSLSAATVKKETNLLGEVRRDALKKYFETHPEVKECQQLLRIVYEKITKGDANEWLKPSVTAAASLPIPAMDHSIRVGYLTERERWLEVLLSFYSLVDHEFTLSANLYEVFTTELEAVKKARALIQ